MPNCFAFDLSKFDSSALYMQAADVANPNILYIATAVSRLHKPFIRFIFFVFQIQTTSVVPRGVIAGLNIT